MPWCRSGTAIVRSVVSWPPCNEPVEANVPKGLPIRVPRSHSPSVLSRKCLSGAAMLPKLLGLPMIRPQHSSRSAPVAYGGPDSGTADSTASQTLDTSGTVRSRADMPSTASTPRATSRARESVAPLRE